MKHNREQRWRRRAGATTALFAASTGVVSMAHVPMANAAAPLPVGESWYMDSVTSAQSYNLGCWFGNQVLSEPGTQYVTSILVFGQAEFTGGVVGTAYAGASGYGAHYSPDTIQSLAWNFASGFYNCTGSDTASRLVLIMSTTNDGSDSLLGSNAVLHGQGWGENVQSTSNLVAGAAAGSQVDVWGGNDIEPDWSSSYTANQWVYGYRAGTSITFAPGNAASGCPQTGTDVASSPCNNGWTVDSLWAVSGQSWMQPIPQTYYSNNVEQWYRISKYSATTKGWKVFFRNSASTSIGYSANNAFDAFNNKINSDPSTAMTLGGDSNVLYAN